MDGNFINSLRKNIEVYLNPIKSSYCFKLGECLIPEKLITINNKKINLKRNRKKLMKDNQNNQYSINMKSYLIGQKINYIEEFIILIQNRSLWINIIDSFNIDKKESDEYKNINYFSIDYFIPEYLACVEVDSDYHINRKILDQARDIYLRSLYHTQTIRFYHFGDNEVRDRENIATLMNWISSFNSPINNYYLLFDYTDILIDNFIYENFFLINILEKLIMLVGVNNFYTNNKHVITGRDFIELSSGINFGKLTDPLMFVADFIDFSKNIIYTEIKILSKITSFRINDIKQIIRYNLTQDNTRSLVSIYGGIPYWISVIKQIPNNLPINSKNKEDELILKYIQNGIFN